MDYYKQLQRFAMLMDASARAYARSLKLYYAVGGNKATDEALAPSWRYEDAHESAQQAAYRVRDEVRNHIRGLEPGDTRRGERAALRAAMDATGIDWSYHADYRSYYTSI